MFLLCFVLGFVLYFVVGAAVANKIDDNTGNYKLAGCAFFFWPVVLVYYIIKKTISVVLNVLMK